MRGERQRDMTNEEDNDGSSPHARGTHLPEPAASQFARFIPACAGNAVSEPVWLSAISVHPRMRGERGAKPNTRYWATGSSPHARGTRPLLKTEFQKWFIPACAGNAARRTGPGTGRSVHPRMRGERSCFWDSRRRENGSSPHARGTHVRLLHVQSSSRFIPACAGNASAVTTPATIATVHPRMRGERPFETGHGHVDRGSSPHARGTLVTVSR